MLACNTWNISHNRLPLGFLKKKKKSEDPDALIHILPLPSLAIQWVHCFPRSEDFLGWELVWMTPEAHSSIHSWMLPTLMELLDPVGTRCIQQPLPFGFQLRAF